MFHIKNKDKSSEMERNKINLCLQQQKLLKIITRKAFNRFKYITDTINEEHIDEKVGRKIH